MWVLWAHASSTARLEQSFRDIADRVKIEGRQDSQVNIFKLVHDWMCDTDERWLLVLDNVDDAGFLFDAQGTTSKTPAKPLHDYLPYCPHGCVIITTRNKEAALQLVEQRDMIALNPMDALQARTLLAKKLGMQVASGNAAELTELATILEHMPLALVQAAAYISQRAPLCSVAQYLDQFRKSEHKRTSLLSYDKDHLRRDREAKNSIITTWQISFEYIQQTRPSAADLLSLMSFFDRQGIPKNVLQTRAEHKEDKHDRKIDTAKTDRSENDNRVHFERTDGDAEDRSRNDSADDFEKDDFDDSDVDDTDLEDNDSEDDTFSEDVTALRNFCFISVSTDGTIFEMHALVQLSMRTWLAANGRLGRYRDQFTNNLCEAFPTGEYENWTVCQVLFAHAKAATGHKPEGAFSLVQWATLLYRAAWYAVEKGSAGEAEMLATQSSKARKKVLGRDHKDTIWGLAMLANAYKIGGKWDAAEELEVQVMETHKTKLGVDHLDTLISMNNLAITYEKQGRWEEAEKLHVQVIETRKTKLGADHPETLTSMNNLAMIYWNQGRWEEAEKLHVQVIETRKTKLRADHPSTLISMNNLAITYEKQGRWEEAEKLHVQVMETHKTKLGADHPETLNSMNNLALIYEKQGRLEEAEKLQVQVIETRKTKLGAVHPSTLISMNNLAMIYWNQGRWEEAEKLHVQVMETRKTKLGADHPDTLASIANLALTYWSQGRWEEAEKLEVQVIETRKTKLGADHPDTLTSMNNLAFTWKSLGQTVKAIFLMQQCVQRSEQVLGASHPRYLSSLLVLEEWEAEQVDVE
jgi:tetratricopeptide (TPR) repeat protein